jgi:hypothetical protein
MDGTALSVPDHSFDFAWSLSSIQQLGGHEAAATAVGELGRVVRLGTNRGSRHRSLLLDEYRHAEFFTRSEIEKYVIGASDELVLVEPVDWSLPLPVYLIDSVVVPASAGRFRRHVVRYAGNIKWTSMM